mgnify:CR=1 FL=1
MDFAAFDDLLVEFIVGFTFVREINKSVSAQVPLDTALAQGLDVAKVADTLFVLHKFTEHEHILHDTAILFVVTLFVDIVVTVGVPWFINLQ